MTLKGKLLIVLCLLGITICNLIGNTESVQKSMKNLKYELENEMEEEDDESSTTQRRYAVAKRDRTWKNPNLPLWSKVKYAGDPNFPNPSLVVTRSYPMFFFEFNKFHQIIDKDSKAVLKELTLYHPKNIDFYRELNNVKNILQKIKDGDIQNCFNFNAYPNLELSDTLIALMNAYQLTGTQRIRLHGFFNAALNDAMVITWFYKFLYEIPRPNQLDPKLETLLCTPYHPSYPSGHAVMGSTAIELLSLLFPEERDQLDRIFSDCRKARLYSGVHFDADNKYGEILGRKIGRYIFHKMHKQKDENGNIIDVFKRPVKKPVLKVPKRMDSEILMCNSLVDQRSVDYFNKWNQ